MTTPTDQLQPQAGSQAWQRFLKLVQDHFETVRWHDDADGRPTLLSLIDLPSGEALTLVPLDAVDTDPAAVLLVSAADCRLPPVRARAAGRVGRRQRLTYRLAEPADGPPGATCPVLLHPPDQPHIPPQAWIEVPEPLARDMWAAPPVGDEPVLLVLLDRPRPDEGHRSARHGFRGRALGAATTVCPFDHAAEFGVVGMAVAPGDGAADHAALRFVVGVVGAVEGEVAERGELGLDAVQPRRGGWCGIGATWP